MRKLLKYAVLFIVGGLVYIGIETLWRGRTDITSFIMGGTAMIITGSLNEFYSWKIPVWCQMLISCAFITVMEFFVGTLFNSDYHIWDYRDLWLNINGQICLGYSVLWFWLSFVGIVLDDFIRWKFFGEDKPRYVWI